MTTTGMPQLEEKDWKTLMRWIRSGQVIPVVGPDLVLVEVDGQPGEVVLTRYLAPRLAARLNLSASGDYGSVNEVVREHLRAGGNRGPVYDELRELLEEAGLSPGKALRDLAAIGGFDLFLSSTFDPFLAQALAAVRPGFREERDVVRFHPNKPLDLPAEGAGHVFHLLGDFNTYPDFAIWDEDYMEFVCGLIESRDQLRSLFELLKNRHLLLLGAPASDWIFRFLLRVARQERLSGRTPDGVGEFLTEAMVALEPPLVFFFDKVVATTRVIDGSPASFVEELSRRWKEQAGAPADDEALLARMPDEMPKDSVFISYASEDRAAALALARALHDERVPVWLDKGRLKAGENYEAALESAVRVHCSFFISLISEITEADLERERFVHTERDWAAQRHMDGYIFYIPVEIRETGRPEREPEAFRKIHSHRLPGGVPTPDFVGYVKQLWETYRVSGRPRG